MPLIITRAEREISARWDGPLLVRHADLTHAVVRGMALDAFFSGNRGPLCRDQCACAVFGGRGPLPDGLKTIVWRAMPDAPLRKAGWDVRSVAGSRYAAADRAEMIAEYAQHQILGTWGRAEGWVVMQDIDMVASAVYVPHEARVHEFASQAEQELRDGGSGVIVQVAGRRIFGEGWETERSARRFP